MSATTFGLRKRHHPVDDVPLYDAVYAGQTIGTVRRRSRGSRKWDAYLNGRGNDPLVPAQSSRDDAVGQLVAAHRRPEGLGPMTPIAATEQRQARRWLPTARQVLHHGHDRHCATCAPVAAHATTSAALARATRGTR